MYYCIINTRTEEANSKVINETENYIINGINPGSISFKFHTSVITIDTRATITKIQMNLTNLDTYILMAKFDIKKFNLYVKKKKETSQE